MSKVCTHCKERKSFTLYSKNKNTKDGCDTLCKECRRIKDKVQAQINRAIIIKAKYKPCHVCNKISDPADVDLHHLDPSKKKKAVSAMVKRSSATLKQEIEKCVPVCRPCHRKIHHGN